MIQVRAMAVRIFTHAKEEAVMTGGKNFFAGLFDFSFKEFVTPRMISILYILIMAIFGLFALVSLIGVIFSGQNLWMIIVIPIGFLIYLIFARMWLEIVMVFFHIMHKVEEIADTQKGQAQSTPVIPIPPPPEA
jgi:hypothetical protein